MEQISREYPFAYVVGQSAILSIIAIITYDEYAQVLERSTDPVSIILLTLFAFGAIFAVLIINKIKNEKKQKRTN